MLTPSAASTSEEPDFDDSERVPCLAIFTPAPAATRAAAVEMLEGVLAFVAAGAAGVNHVEVVFELPAPPRRMALTPAVISPTVSPRTRIGGDGLRRQRSGPGEGSPLKTGGEEGLPSPRR